MKKILCIDGGGAKGIIPITVLSHIEKTLKKDICETFDLIVGSSVGAIIGGILSAKIMGAETLRVTIKETLPELFRKRIRIPFFQPKYSREPLINIFDNYITPTTRMKDCKTKFMCTSVNMVDGRTHFFKSWEEKDGNLLLEDAMTRSYAAPLFFGPVIDNKNKAIWLDGGTGISNCPLDKTYIEIKRQNWDKEKVHVLSLGCGSVNFGVPFNKGKHYYNLRQILFYSNPEEGGLAREQSTGEQVVAFKEFEKDCDNITFQRLDINNMPKKEDGMDKIKYIKKYKEYGEKLAEKVNYDYLK